MNIAVVGSSGYIARFLIESFKRNKKIDEILKIGQTNPDVFLDLNEPEKFNYNILYNIDYIIFTAAISGPDRCTDKFDFCWSVNVDGTNYFITEAIRRKCKVLFFSSDAVFGDIPGEIYTENSETVPLTPYGCMKKMVEDQFKESKYFKAIRLSYVVSAQDRFISYCLSCIKSNKIADIYHPFYRNCISVHDVINVVLWFIENWDSYKFSILNVAGKELVSRLRIADELNRIYNGRLQYIVSYPGAGFYASRPPITQMKSLYMQQYQIIEDNTFTEKIKKELEGIKNVS